MHAFLASGDVAVKSGAPSSVSLLVVCASLTLACAGRQWVRVDPRSLAEGAPHERARLTFADRSTVTVASPRVVRDRAQGEVITGEAVERCVAGRCVNDIIETQVRLDVVTSAEVWRTPSPRPPPTLRVDLAAHFPYVLTAPGTGLAGSALAAGVSLRGATRWGVGLALTFGGGGQYEVSLGPDQRLKEAFVNAMLGDVMGLYRVRLVGNDRRGLAIDVLAGVSFGRVEWNAGHGASTGCTWLGGCSSVTEYVSPLQTFSTGQRIGSALGLSFDGRAGAFVGGLGVTWRALYYNDSTAPRVTDDGPVHIVTVSAHAGVGFWM